jgi:hypothetical protein
MKCNSGLLWFVFLLTLNSCVSYEKFSIEVFKPSEVRLTPDAKKVVIISRNLKYVHDTLQNYQVKNRQLIKDKVHFNTDSLSIITCMDSLSGKLVAQNQFNKVEILPINTFPVSRVKEIRPAKSEFYKVVSEKTGADILILLDMFSCFYSQKNDDSDLSANVVTSNIWTVYSAREQKIIDRFTQVDTLYWDETDENGKYKKLRIPDKRNAISLAAGVIGENYAKHILPGWAKVDRTIMQSSDSEFQKATKLAQNNKWEEAVPIWQVYSESKSKRNKVIAWYNLALASEMNGDVDRAIELTDQAAKASSGPFLSSENEAVRKYSAVLYQRKNEINKLNQQYENRR